jgi:hypothetical protein
MLAAAVTTAASESDRLDLWVGLIAGASALLGAAIGGLIAGRYSLKGERARQEFAREEAARLRKERLEDERRAARGVARVVSGEFRKLSAVVRTAQEHESLAAPISITEVPVADLQLLARQLTREQWHSIVIATLVVDQLVNHSEKHSIAAEGKERYKDLMAEYESVFETAQWSLGQLTSDDAEVTA